MPRSAYHFYYFCRPAAEQARWFIRNVPRDRSALPPVLDMEWNPQLADLQAQARRRRRCAARCDVFLSMVERHYGKKPIIYTSIDFFEDNDLSTFRGYPYWLRSVAGHPAREIWRPSLHLLAVHRHRRRARRCSGNADINVFNGSVAAWKKWLKANTQ